MIGILACVFVFLLQLRQYHSNYEDIRKQLEAEVTALSSLPDAPIAVMEVSVAHRLSDMMHHGGLHLAWFT